MSTLIRTIKLQVVATEDQKKILLDSISAYTDSYNRVVSVAWNHRISNGVELHHKTYYSERDISGMPSQLLISARMKATESIKSIKTWTKKIEAENKRRLKAKRPRKLKKLPGMTVSKSQAIRYDARSYTINLKTKDVSLLTVSGRVKVKLHIPEVYSEISSSWKPTSSDLCVDEKGKLWLHVCLQKDVSDVETTNTVVGCDLGAVHPATDSNGKHYGNTYWAVVEKRRKSLISKLQSKGTKSSRRHLKKLSRTRNRFRTDCDHVISKQIISSLSSGDTIVFEDLTDIRDRMNLNKASRVRIHGWSFNRLQFFIGYKALSLGIRVEHVDPRYTSQKCNRCKHIFSQNRVSQSEFKCLSCGHKDNADVNAAKNIRDNYLSSRAVINQPIVESLLVCKPATLVVGN